MKSLKLNKINISKLSNPYDVMAGIVQNGQQAGTTPVPFTQDFACTHTKDKDDPDCNNQTNGGGTLVRTGIAEPVKPNDSL